MDRQMILRSHSDRGQKCKKSVLNAKKLKICLNFIDILEWLMAIIKYEKERFQDPERKKKVIEYQRSRRLRSPEKYKATNAVNNSKRDGKITVGVCEVCGSHDVEAHHTDYNRPLDVHWLCRKHHLFNHGKLAAQGYSDGIGRIEKRIEQSRKPDDMKRSRYSQGRMF